MNASGSRNPGETFMLGGIATALIDSGGIVRRWSVAAAELLDLSAAEVCGHPVARLLADTSASDRHAAPCGPGVPAVGQATLQHRSGHKVEVTYHMVQQFGDSESLILAAPTRRVADWEQGASFLDALFAQDRMGLAIHDVDLSVVRTNLDAGLFGGSASALDTRLDEVFSNDDIEAALSTVLDTGVPVIGREVRVRSPHRPGQQCAVFLSVFRLADAAGRPTGAVTVFSDATEHQRTQRRLELRQAAATRIGGSLDVTRTAQELADVLVPALADLAAVDLAEAVLEGGEPPKFRGGGHLHLRRTAVASSTGPWPPGLLSPGESYPRVPDSPELRRFQSGESFILTDRSIALSTFERFPDAKDMKRLFLPERGHSALSAPLIARGLLLGQVVTWRTEQTEPFEQEDADLLAEITSRSALSVDNARRYTREHRTAVALQRRLLPRAASDTPAAVTAGLYRPAAGGAEISGDWFDVLPLPSLRVAFVVGDVIGHGLPATATMGRLRTAVHTLAGLELGPAELLTRLDGLVQQLADETPSGLRDTIGATCLYAVYDPVARLCTFASAGHLPPLVIRPDGTAEEIDVLPGPPLGVGGMPFETSTVVLAPDSVLAMYTDGLLARDDHDLDAGIQHLTSALRALHRPDRSLQDTGRALLAGTGAAQPRDDIALLLARTRAIPAEDTAHWEFPADPAVVTDARKVTARQLTLWGLDELAFTTELIVSELVTNAVRYAGGPIGLRLIRGNVLVCEVTDPSNTQPRLYHARTSDEGGRGLFLVAQLSNRWGSRYGLHGKTIWTEQSLTAVMDQLF
ncbi:ATP-binding SpoIIE family protein phosphatase [Streptomyces chartreusis]|uniref:ATP-binding SpoIIE family protein phosphatase n=1 Tax=Streptomyces chartreusis TaxID=1969 RepID=UPI00362F5B74